MAHIRSCDHLSHGSCPGYYAWCGACGWEAEYPTQAAARFAAALHFCIPKEATA